MDKFREQANGKNTPSMHFVGFFFRVFCVPPQWKNMENASFSRPRAHTRGYRLTFGDFPPIFRWMKLVVVVMHNVYCLWVGYSPKNLHFLGHSFFIIFRRWTLEGGGVVNFNWSAEIMRNFCLRIKGNSRKIQKMQTCNLHTVTHTHTGIHNEPSSLSFYSTLVQFLSFYN